MYELVNRIKASNMSVWVEDEAIKLAFSGDKPCPELLDEIKANKPDLLALLQLNKVASKYDFWEREILRLPSKPNVLSFSQERMLFIEQFEQGTDAYHIPYVFELDDDVDLSALEQAFQFMAERHTVLNSIYLSDEQDQPYVHHLNEAASIKVEVLPENTSLKQTFDTEIAQPFDLTAEPPMRLIRYIGAEKNYLLVIWHHIAFDGWSTDVFLDELAPVYQAYHSGQRPDLAEPVLDFSDYALWQRQHLQGDNLDKQLAYWTRQLSDVENLALPTDRPRPASVDYRGQDVVFTFEGELSRQLRELARERDTTLYTVLLSGFYTTLAMLSGQKSLIVGTPSDNRHYPQVANLIGYFVNTLPLRADVSLSQSVKDFIADVHRTVFDAKGHQDLPFEQMVEALNVERDMSRHPVFQVMFAVQSFGEKGLKENPLPFKQAQFDEVRSKTNPAKFDLSMYLDDGEDDIYGSINFATSLFDEVSIHRFIKVFMCVLKGFVENSQQALGQIDILSEEEKHTLLNDWNNTEADYPSRNLFEGFFEQAESHPNATAVISSEGDYSYQEVSQHVLSLTHALTQSGVQRGELIGVLTEKSERQVVSTLGIMAVGAAYLPLNVAWPASRLHDVLQAGGVSRLVISKAQYHQLQMAEGSQQSSDPHWLNAYQLILVDDAISQPAPENWQKSLPTVQPEELAYVIFTSGSTGKPKGVVISHDGAMNTIEAVNQTFNVQAHDRVLALSDLSFDLSVYDLFGTLATGAAIVFPDQSEVQSPSRWADLVEAHQVTIWNSVPQLAQLLAEEAELTTNKLRTLRVVLMSGDWIPLQLPNQLKTLIPGVSPISLGGATEGSIWSIWYPIEEVKPDWTSIPYGLAMPNQTMWVLNEFGGHCPVGATGEIHIGGVGVAKGYYKDPVRSEAQFFDHPTLGRLYRTGDLGSWNQNGYIEFKGRKDFQVKVRGYRVELGEIETLLCQQPSVKHAVVIDVERNGVKTLAAYVVPEGNGECDFETLKTVATEQLPEYMVPSTFTAIEDVPLTANGKLDRKALPEPVWQSVDIYTPPDSPLEQLLVNTWQDVLSIERVGTQDNFFHIGGNSIAAIRMISMLNRALSEHTEFEQIRKLTVTDLFRYPNIVGLATYLEGEGEEEHSGLLHCLKRSKTKKKQLICVPYGGGSPIAYQPLASCLPDDFSLYALNFPGHDFARADESLMPLPQIAEQCVEEILSGIEGDVYLFGHCVGGALTLDIARRLESQGRQVHGVFLGATFPFPRLPFAALESLRQWIPFDRLISNRLRFESILSLGGFSESLEEDELDFMMSAMRQDVSDAEDFYTQANLSPEQYQIQAPILSIYGDKDKSTEFFEERHQDWQAFSSDVDLEVLPDAGHFFIKHQPHELSRILDRQITKWQSDKHHPNSEPPEKEHSKSQESFSFSGWLQGKRAEQETNPSLTLFFIIVFGQFMSMLGTGVTAFALGTWVYLQTGSVTEFAYISVFALLPGILMLPFSGALVDRWDRRIILMLSDTISVCGTLFIFFMVTTSELQIWQIYTVVAISSIGQAFQRPAYIATIAQLVPKRYLGRANGLAQLASSTSQVIAVFAGGYLFLEIGLRNVLMLDIAAFCVAFTTLLLIRFPNRMFKKRELPLIQEIMEGWQYILQRKEMVAMVIFFAVYNFAFSAIMVLGTPLILSVGEADLLGRVLAFDGIGQLVGGLLMGIWGGTRLRAHGMIGFTLLTGVSMMIAGLMAQQFFLMLGFFGIGMSLALVNAHWQCLIQVKVGLELQGRVIATNQMMSWSMMPLAYFVIGYMAEHVVEPFVYGDSPVAELISSALGEREGLGVGVLLAGLGAFAVLWGIASLLYRPLRLMEQRLPDVIPDEIPVAEGIQSTSMKESTAS
ncbi:putative ANTIBIOTIC SYNTHETASE fused with CoA-dependent acyltransferase and alpha/beta-Hydrolase and Major facilitator superfamily transporter [Vibrio nigripulchritudo MADA3029]|uniref:non-ribosomal peptide synthetase n=1 Tax=Vibrio nigripulchritudo TaxID=28173 RepID=UPI0003B1E3A9|nr:non-ribosomal peptide synthetase [Vibrio nigripulchritudo]CCN47566.1 putative ANTIBIOTIC SYNTHETASE fused with CoA-dependent acyltransferase and alpha/beta-Hydrolase and Major facilitator superfamily transporter [Vibrio nigripulchritudo MADA3020]CCN56609.1 putative ANTIBIOTIC SYNTHETASE fused with CoA-dependent acyltransferase and alpha/beta-Hydrolase and Major facilitator superfamily transporter [Vibrio nigripulchritudo MADA3021]CCN58765.1 putative ANTIBIOTIC SYNTHETASE fused with CoA-depend